MIVACSILVHKCTHKIVEEPTIKLMTQCNKTLEYMKRKGGIIPIDALSEFGYFSLAQRIYDLKKRGHSILTERISKQGMFGKVNFAKYRLESSGE